MCFVVNKFSKDMFCICSNFTEPVAQITYFSLIKPKEKNEIIIYT